MNEIELIGSIYSQLLEEFGFDYCEKDLWMLAENLAKRIVNAQPTKVNLEKLSDIKELLENALYQPLSSSEIEGNTQAALDLVNKLIGEWSE